MSGTSTTTRDKEIARNPHPPEELGRDGPNKRYRIYEREYLTTPAVEGLVRPRS